MLERRKYPRFVFSHKVKYNDNPHDPLLGHEAKAKTLNVSKGGICLLTEEPLEKDDVLKLKIFCFSPWRPVTAYGRVVWSMRKNDDTFLTGLAFTRIGWTECDRLIRK